MRIISGKYKGRRFTPPASFRARPTTDYAKESLFNVLSVRYDFTGMGVLDLFSGTGSVGLEFISRGAEPVVLVEGNRRHADFIRKTITELAISGSEVIHTNVKTFLKGGFGRYDIVFADPPYDLDWIEEIPDLIEKSGVLKDDALVIIEHPGTISFAHHKWFTEHRQYGSVNFSLLSTQK
ncbi:MAG: 16S rRNA (guanine(966)-N(2))-methyltransferase RsmD [Bacteroidales bacterium]